MSFVDLGNVKGASGPQGPQGPTGPTGATGPQGPPGPDLEVRTTSFTKALSASTGVGSVVYDVAAIPVITGYTPIFAIISTDTWDIMAAVRSLSSGAMYYNVFTVKDTTAITVTLTVTIYYQANS